MTIRTAVRGRFLSIALILGAAAFFAQPASAQMAAGKAKFVGNVTGNSVPANFGTYWNQVTPENATKWGSVEGTQNQMNWAGADAAYNWAQTNGYKFKFHTFVWGSQFPGWLSGSQHDAAARRDRTMDPAGLPALSEHLGHRRGQRADQDGDAMEGRAGR